MIDYMHSDDRRWFDCTAIAVEYVVVTTGIVVRNITEYVRVKADIVVESIKRIMPLLIVVFGICLHIFDIGIDVYVGIKHLSRLDVWWGGLTLFIVFFNALISNILSGVLYFIKHLNNKIIKRHHRLIKKHYRLPVYQALPFFLCFLGPMVVMVELLVELIGSMSKHTEVDKTSQNYLYLVKLTEVCLEAVPQLILQIYIVIVVDNKLSSAELCCIIGSFMSACWGLWTYIKYYQYECGADSTIRSSLTLLVIALMLPARAFAFGLLGTVKSWLVFALLGPHLLAVCILRLWETCWKTRKMRPMMRPPWYTNLPIYLKGAMGMFVPFIILKRVWWSRFDTISLINGIFLVTENITCSLIGYFYGKIALKTSPTANTHLSSRYLNLTATTATTCCKRIPETSSGISLVITVAISSILSVIGLIFLKDKHQKIKRAKRTSNIQFELSSS